MTNPNANRGDPQTIDGIEIPRPYTVWRNGVFTDWTPPPPPAPRAPGFADQPTPEPEPDPRPTEPSIDVDCPAGERILPAPVWVSARAIGVDGQQRIQVTLGDRHTLWVPRSDLADARTLIRTLVGHGYLATEKAASQLAEFLTACLASPTIPAKRLVHGLGHVGGGAFVFPDEAITSAGPDDTIVSSLAMPGLAPHGSLDAWREFVVPRMQHNVVQLALASVFAAPVLPVIGESSFSVYFWGQHKTGKSAAQILALSAFSSLDNGLYGTLNKTGNHVLSAVDRFVGLPVVMDEWEQGKAAGLSPSTLIYDIASNKSRGRVKRDGTPMEQRSFSTIVLTSGEREISDYSEDGEVTGGARARLVSFRITQKVVEARDWRAAAAQNYGHAGREFITRLMRDERDFRCEFLELTQALEAKHPDVEPTRVKLCATLAYASQLARDYLALPFKDAKEWGSNVVLAMTSCDNVADEAHKSGWERALDAIRGLVQTRQASFPYAGNQAPASVPTLGYIDLTRLEVQVATSAFDRALRDAKVAPKAARAELFDHGLMLRASNGRFALQRSTSIGKAYFYVLNYHALFGDEAPPQPPPDDDDDVETIPGSLPFVMPDLGEGA